LGGGEFGGDTRGGDNIAEGRKTWKGEYKQCSKGGGTGKSEKIRKSQIVVEPGLKLPLGAVLLRKPLTLIVKGGGHRVSAKRGGEIGERWSSQLRVS